MEKEKCWAAVLYGAQDMRFEQVAVPEIGPYDTLIRMKACVLAKDNLKLKWIVRYMANIIEPELKNRIILDSIG